MQLNSNQIKASGVYCALILGVLIVVTVREGDHKFSTAQSRTGYAFIFKDGEGFTVKVPTVYTELDCITGTFTNTEDVLYASYSDETASSSRSYRLINSTLSTCQRAGRGELCGSALNVETGEIAKTCTGAKICPDGRVCWFSSEPMSNYHNAESIQYLYRHRNDEATFMAIFLLVGFFIWIIVLRTLAGDYDMATGKTEVAVMI